MTERRDEFAKACREAGVPTAIHYLSAAQLRCRPTASSRAPPGLRQAEWLARRVISLPMHRLSRAETQDLHHRRGADGAPLAQGRRRPCAE